MRAIQLAIRAGEVLWYSAKDFFVDDGLHWAAAIAFYGMLSVFPLVLAGIAIAAFFCDPHWATEKATTLLGDFTPRNQKIIQSVIETAIANRGRATVVSIVVLLVAGTRVFSAVIRALNVAYDVDETYSWPQRILIQLAMLLSVGLLFAAALSLDVVGAIVKQWLAPLTSDQRAILAVISWPLPVLLVLGGFFFLYRFVPRSHCNWKSTLSGALAASALLSGARTLFAEYVERLATYSQVYGWLSTGIVLLVWTYIAAVVTVFCGELVSHIQLMIFEGVSGKEITKRHYARSPRRKTHSS